MYGTVRIPKFCVAMTLWLMMVWSGYQGKFRIDDSLVLISISGGFAWPWSPQLGWQEDCAQPHHSQHKVQKFVQSCTQSVSYDVLCGPFQLSSKMRFYINIHSSGPFHTRHLLEQRARESLKQQLAQVMAAFSTPVLPIQNFANGTLC